MTKGKNGYKVRTITCVSCGVVVTDHMSAKQKYCSLECYRTNKRPTRLTGEEIACEVCGKLSYISGKRLKTTKNFFCSPEHANEWQGRNKDEYICKTCSNPFRRSPSNKNHTTPTYCSVACRDADPDHVARLIGLNADQAKGKTNKLELAGYAILDGLGIPYRRQELLFGKFCVDAFYPNSKIVIQFDGDYWHGNPLKFPQPDKRQARRMWMDRSQDAYLKKAGCTVLRFWETDVKSNPQSAAATIVDAHAALSLAA